MRVEKGMRVEKEKERVEKGACREGRRVENECE